MGTGPTPLLSKEQRSVVSPTPNDGLPAVSVGTESGTESDHRSDIPVAPGHRSLSARVCGRCHMTFPPDPSVDPFVVQQWWLCPACRRALLGVDAEAAPSSGSLPGRSATSLWGDARDGAQGGALSDGTCSGPGLLVLTAVPT